MMGKNGNVMQRICMAGMMVSVALTLAGCGNDVNDLNDLPEGAVETWEGAQADLSKGLRPMEAVYHYGDYDWGDEQTASITYDLGGNITSVAEPPGVVAFTLQHAPEDFLRVLDADGGLYSYDDYRQKEYYEFSAAENYDVQTRELELDGGWVHIFSESGALLSALNPDGETTCRWTYDEQGRLISKESDSSKITYTYDEQGRLISEESDSSKITYTYEKDSLLASVSENGHEMERYEREYDTNGNIVCLKHFEAKLGDEMQLEYLKRWYLTYIEEWEYDENGKKLQYQRMEGHRADTEDYYETCEITRYNDSEDIIEQSTNISIDGKEYTVEKKEYLYDEEGRITEVNSYELLVGMDMYFNDLADNNGERADWCRSGGNTELYITEKVTYRYDMGKEGNRVRYHYEANEDYSKVNLIEKDGSGWIDLEGYWTITYYTEEEVEQYLHDQEFTPVN